MPKVGQCEMDGESGTAYKFNVYTSDVVFNDFIPGVYVLSEVSDEGEERFVLVGETDNIFPHLQNHPEQERLSSEGFNRISFYMNASREVRSRVVSDLVLALKPAIN